jgi:hypothetical protein
MTQEEKPRDGGAVRHYVVLYDSVPGGTGYLRELLADKAKTLVDVIKLALEKLRTCACNSDPEKDGCYRCVYQHRLGKAMNRISRNRARDILESLSVSLDSLVEVKSVTDIYVNPNFDSELEARFIEGLRQLKPFLLHRFAPGMYAVDRSKKDELARLFAELGFSPAKDTRNYPGAAEAVEARASLHKLLAEAREAAVDPTEREGSQIDPANLHVVPGTRGPQSHREPDIAPQVNAQQARQILDEAMARDAVVEMVYLARTGQHITFFVRPERLAFKGESPVLVGTDVTENERRTYVLENIERLRIQENDDG